MPPEPPLETAIAHETDGPQATAVTPEMASPESAVTPETVAQLLTELARTLRAHHLYHKANPAYRRLVESLHAEYSRVLEELPELEIRIQQDAITWEGVQVYSSSNRSDSLAFLLYKDGVRGLRFLAGFQDEELDPFISVLNQARLLKGEGDDLVTLLWELDFRMVQYSAAELFTQGAEMFEPDDQIAFDLLRVQRLALDEGLGEETPGRARAATPDAEDAEAWKGTTAAGDGLDAGLTVLEGAERERLEAEVDREMARDVRRDVSTALLDSIETEEGELRQALLRCMRPLLADAMSGGHLREVLTVLSELEELAARPSFLDQASFSHMEDLFAGLSSEDVLSALVARVEEGTPLDADAFQALVERLRAPALGALARQAARCHDARLKNLLDQAVESLGSRYPMAFIDLLETADPALVVRAARYIARLQLAEAEKQLVSLLRRLEPEIRAAAVESLHALGTPEAGDAITGALKDVDRRVRIAAAQALTRLKHRPGRQALREAVLDRGFKSRDLSEKRAFLDGYGTVAGEEGVAFLDGLLNGKGLFGHKESAELRACAAHALKVVGTPEALNALLRAASDKDRLVRHAVEQALRSGT